MYNFVKVGEPWKGDARKMKVRCEAIVENPVQRDNLCQCIGILGGAPVVDKDKISVVYDGEKGETMISLFEQCVRHKIIIAE